MSLLFIFKNTLFICLIFNLTFTSSTKILENQIKESKRSLLSLEAKTDSCYVIFQNGTKESISSFGWLFQKEIEIDFHGKNLIAANLNDCWFYGKNVFIDFSSNNFKEFKLLNKSVTSIYFNDNKETMDLIELSNIKSLEKLVLPVKGVKRLLLENLPKLKELSNNEQRLYYPMNKNKINVKNIDYLSLKKWKGDIDLNVKSVHFEQVEGETLSLSSLEDESLAINEDMKFQVITLTSSSRLKNISISNKLKGLQVKLNQLSNMVNITSDNLTELAYLTIENSKVATLSGMQSLRNLVLKSAEIIKYELSCVNLAKLIITDSTIQEFRLPNNTLLKVDSLESDCSSLSEIHKWLDIKSLKFINYTTFDFSELNENNKIQSISLNFEFRLNLDLRKLKNIRSLRINKLPLSLFKTSYGMNAIQFDGNLIEYYKSPSNNYFTINFIVDKNISLQYMSYSKNSVILHDNDPHYYRINFLSNIPKPRSSTLVVTSADNKVLYDKLNDVCSICLSKFEVNAQIEVLSCNHVYHFNCIDTWFKNNIKCPLCNSENEERTTYKLSKIEENKITLKQ